MENTKEVNTSIGIFVVKKPKAGVRNRSMAAAEGDNGNIKEILLMTTLMPACIAKRPADVDQDVPINQILDELEIEDYDKLFEALASMILPEKEEEVNQKKTKLVHSSTTD